MQFKVFTVPAVSGEEQNTALNNFLASHKIIEVQNIFSEKGFWTFCVRYTLGEKKQMPQQGKKDYKNELSEEEFARFSALRLARKQIAADEGLPAFAVFTDAELAEISKLKELTPAVLLNLEGIGKGRVENFGKKIIAIVSLAEAYQPAEKPNETLQ